MSNKTQFVLAFPDRRDLRRFVRSCIAEAKAYDAGQAGVVSNLHSNKVKSTGDETGDLDVYVEGADLEADNLGVYVEGADLEADDLGVYVEGSDLEADDLGVYVEGADLEADDLGVYVEGADLEADDLGVYVEGADLEADDLDVHAEGADDLDVYVEGADLDAEEEFGVQFETEDILLADDEGAEEDEASIVTVRQPRRRSRMLKVSVISSWRFY